MTKRGLRLGTISLGVISLGVISLGLAASVASAASASPVAGRWRTPNNNGLVEVTDCGAGICGHVVTSDRIKAEPGLTDRLNKDAALRSRPLKGVPLFEGLTGGPKEWNGKVYNPEDGKTYTGTVTSVDADTMKLTGCIVRPLCKTQTWTRAR
jgi:uncharacterized protein (DUF2147 family)